MAQPYNPQHTYPAARKPGHLLRRALIGLLCLLLALQPMLAQAAPALAQATLQAGGPLALLAPKLDARGDITLKAERGRVYLGAGKDSDYIHEDYSKTGWFKWAAGEQGRYEETVRLSELRAGGTLRIEAGSGVVVDYKLAGGLNESIASLSRLPELAWLGRLKGRAAIDWRSIEEVHDRWQRHDSGLGGPGVTLVALAVGAYLGGIDFSQLLGTGLEGSMAAGFNAGMTSLSVRAGVSLAAHGGDIGAVFEDLLSSDTLLAVATAGLTAGLTAHLEQAAGLDGVLPAGQVARHIERGLIRATVRAGVGTAIQGGSLDEHLVQALQWQAVSTLGELGAREIGQAFREQKLDRFTQLLAHAALGCATGSVAGDCGAGALGGVVGELAAQALLDNKTAVQVGEELAEAVQSGQLSAAKAEALAWGWQERGVDLSVLAAGLSVALAGGDVDVGAGAAENAVRHNALGVLGGVVKVIQALKRSVKKRALAKKERSVDDIISNAKPGRVTKGKTRQYERAGGFDQANRDFDSLGVKNVKDINTAYGPGRTGALSDGRKVTVRPGSTDGRPTLEIRRPNKVGQEIRYY